MKRLKFCYILFKFHCTESNISLRNIKLNNVNDYKPKRFSISFIDEGGSTTHADTCLKVNEAVVPGRYTEVSVEGIVVFRRDL